jgi:hypothetical protein
LIADAGKFHGMPEPVEALMEYTFLRYQDDRGANAGVFGTRVR